MPFDFAAVRFGCIRAPERPKAFRPLVSATPLRQAWGRLDCPVVLGHNDTLGTCVPTAVLNAIAPLRWAAGDHSHIPNALAPELYEEAGPYRGTPETDTGMDPIAMFEWWKAHDILGWKLRGWYDIDHSDEAAIRKTIEAELSVFAVQQIRAPQESQVLWEPAGGDIVGLHATSYNTFVGPVSACACWGVQQLVDEPFISGAAAQVLDVYGLDIVRA